ncbi:MAG TPA: hypothetical protein VM490_12220 [Armatimonadaceae bacterium]|nr:hypothetical protein [Armatimonadaceae bacterium]
MSGRPVSFIQDLYQPLYLPRPVVPPDVIASPYPQLAEGAVEEANKPAGALTSDPFSPARGPLTPAAPAPSLKAGMAGGGAGGRGGALLEAESAGERVRGLIRESGVAAQAEGERAGEQFAYNIRTPVTLPRQQAAMIPVVAQEISGDKVSLFNADSGTGRFPLNAVRLKNDTGLHLKGGPVTLFDGGTYAGDARMEDVPPGDARLITYAVDLGVEGERQGTGTRVTERTLSVREGVLRETLRVRHETTYTFRNKDDKPRTLLVEHPFSANQKLVQPDSAAERTRDRYRFELALAPGKSEKLTVVTEEPTQEVVALLNADVNQILAYAGRSEGVSPELRTALREIAARRQRIAELQSQAAQKEAEVKAIEADQDRIRKNMTALDKASALYKRYVTELDAQETRIQALRAEANRLRGQSAAAERDLRAYINGLTIGP